MRARFKIFFSKVRRHLGAEDGAALAELAVLVPLLLVMLAAVSEIGRLFQNYTSVAKTTRAAARYLSNHQLTTIETNRAKNLVVCGKLVCGAGDTAIVNGLAAGNV